MYSDQWPADEGPLRHLLPASARLRQFYRHLFLWVLQGWLAMFYIGAALAKLTQPQDLLTYLMQWPGLVDPDVVRAAGLVELALALGVLAPLFSWRVFRPVLLVSTAALLCEALAMAVYHAGVEHLALVAVNVALAVTAAAIVYGRRPSADRRVTRP